MLPPCSIHPDFERMAGPAAAFRIDFSDHEAEVSWHRHRQGQLILALHGAVTCMTADGMWIVPPGYAVWIPGNVPHSNQATAHARLVYLFVEPCAVTLPAKACALSISSMLREMILHLADIPDRRAPGAHVERLIGVALEELSLMPRGGMELPVSGHPKIAALAAALTAAPGDRRTLGQWSTHLAMSERSLKRLIDRETGLSFGRWRRRLHLIVALRALAGGATVQKVADDLGYGSTTAFIVMFKKAMGTTPTRYVAGPDGGAEGDLRLTGSPTPRARTPRC